MANCSQDFFLGGGISTAVMCIVDSVNVFYAAQLVGVFLCIIFLEMSCSIAAVSLGKKEAR